MEEERKVVLPNKYCPTAAPEVVSFEDGCRGRRRLFEDREDLSRYERSMELSANSVVMQEGPWCLTELEPLFTC